MADGVAEVQRAPLAGLERISPADRQLQPRAALDDRVAAGSSRRRAAAPRSSISRQSAASPMIAALMHSAIPSRRRRTGSERRAASSEKTATGGQKAPTAFFAAAEVDRHLAADGAVGLRQPGGRDMDERQPARVEGSRGPDEVADGAAADRDQWRAALDAARATAPRGSAPACAAASPAHPRPPRRHAGHATAPRPAPARP